LFQGGIKINDKKNYVNKQQNLADEMTMDDTWIYDWRLLIAG